MRYTLLAIGISAVAVGIANAVVPGNRDAVVAENRSPDEKQVVAWIGRLGGVARRDETNADRPVIEVVFDETELGDDDIFNLLALPKLQTLEISHTKKTTAEGLANLKVFKELRELRLHGTNLNDQTLADLSALTKLEVFHIQGTKLTDAGLAHIKQLFNLRDLCLAQNAITDAGLVSLGNLTELRKLNLGYTKLKGPGLRHLAKLKKLTWLSVWSTEVDDKCIPDLKALERLEYLGCLGTRITPKGAAEIREALPNVRIEGDLKLRVPKDNPRAVLRK